MLPEQEHENVSDRANRHVQGHGHMNTNMNMKINMDMDTETNLDTNTELLFIWSWTTSIGQRHINRHFNSRIRWIR
jgi:hypothetical protein